MEIGSHTLYHANLGTSTPDQVREQLARSVTEIRRTSRAIPWTRSGSRSGSIPTTSRCCARASGRASATSSWAPSRSRAAPPPAGIARLRPVPGPAHPDGSRRRADARGLPRGRAHPGRRYVSDGDPRVISFPKAHAGQLDLEALRAAGYTFRGY
jgi:peptidoglycan/xylan/chitin deacetylase (PgdA/CDA1 family)